MSYIFVSYSRKQLYFAESVALHLQRAGLEVWFDLQQLGPGVDWSAALEAGYNNCEKLVLIASRDAIASPYVRDEWEAALRNGREVIVVLNEAVDLPDALRACPVYDARTRFTKTIQSLIDYLQGKAPARHDVVPRPGWFPLPLKMPFALWLTIFVLLMPGLSAFITLTAALPLFRDISIALYPLYGFVIVILPVTTLAAIQIWRHAYAHEVIRKFRWNLFWMQLIASVGCAAAAYAGAVSNIPAALIGLLFAPLPLVNLYWAWGVWRRSPDVLRWFPSGLADQTMRERIHGKLLPTDDHALLADAPVRSTKIRYTIHAQPADRALVRVIDSLFQKAGHTPAAPDQSDAHLVVVSNRTSKQWLLDLDQTITGRIVYILGTPIASCPELKPAFERQWVDFRTGDLETIQSLAGQFTEVRLSSTRYAMQVSPGRFTEHTLPGAVRTAQVALMVGLAFPVAWGVMSFKVTGWMIALASVAVFFYFDGLLTRKVSLPNPLRWGNFFAWYAAPAPTVEDAVGMEAEIKTRRKRWLGFALVIAGVFANILNSQIHPPISP